MVDAVNTRAEAARLLNAARAVLGNCDKFAEEPKSVTWVMNNLINPSQSNFETAGTALSRLEGVTDAAGIQALIAAQGVAPAAADARGEFTAIQAAGATMVAAGVSAIEAKFAGRERSFNAASGRYEINVFALTDAADFRAAVSSLRGALAAIAPAS